MKNEKLPSWVVKLMITDGWTEVERAPTWDRQAQYYEGLPPGGNGGVKAILPIPSHCEKRLIEKYAFKLLQKMLVGKALSRSDFKYQAEMAVMLARFTIEESWRDPEENA